MLQTILRKLQNVKKIYLVVIAVIVVIASGAGVAIASPGLFSFDPASQAQSSASATASPQITPSAEVTSEAQPSSEATHEPSKEAEAPAGTPPSAPAPAPDPASPVVAAPVPVVPAPAAPAPVTPPAPTAPVPVAPVPAPVPAAAVPAPIQAPAAPAPVAPPAPAAPVVSEYAQLVQSIVAPWCGYVNVLVDDPSVVSGDVYGMSWWGSNKLGIRSGIPIAITKDMALHECGHMLQARVFPNKQDAVNRLNALYGTNYAIETNARCISAYLHPNALPAGVGSGATARWHSAECAGIAGEAAIKIVQGIRP